MATDTRTIIGSATRISGQLEGDEDLTIQGRVDGKIRLTRTLTVEPAGIVVADVDVKDLVLSGVLVGNVTASDSVHLTERGRMVGDINSPRVIIVSGASFRGRVDMGDMEAARTEQRLSARREAPAARPVQRVEGKSAPRPPAAPVRHATGGAPRPPSSPPRQAPGNNAPRPAATVASAAPRPPAPPPRPVEAPRVAAVSAGAGNVPPWAKKKLKKRQ